MAAPEPCWTECQHRDSIGKGERTEPQRYEQSIEIILLLLQLTAVVLVPRSPLELYDLREQIFFVGVH